MDGFVLHRQGTKRLDGQAGLGRLDCLGYRRPPVSLDSDQPHGQREKVEPDPPYEHPGGFHDQIP
jgi:hypothetical protein